MSTPSLTLPTGGATRRPPRYDSPLWKLLTDQRHTVRLISRVSVMLTVLGCTALLALTAPSTTLAQQVTVTADKLRVEMSVADHHHAHPCPPNRPRNHSHREGLSKRK